VTPLLVAWVAFPLLLCGLSLGCGLLLEHTAGRRLPGALVLPAGFAVVIVASSLTTMSATTAGFTAPLVVALAVAGIGSSLRDRRRPEVGAAATALAVFCVYAAPIVLSGSATFAGYISLDDTATWFALVGALARRPRNRVSDRIDAAARRRARTDGPGHGLALPAVHRVRSRDGLTVGVRARLAASP
jgi:hypothetical protein